MYPEFYKILLNPKLLSESETFFAIRELTRTDDWFRAYYVMRFRHFDSNHIRSGLKWIGKAKELNILLLLLLWFRGGLKSSMFYNNVIGEIINNPNIRIGYNSGTQSKANGHLGNIKKILEMNKRLSYLFPEIFYKNPRKEAEKWSVDTICVQQTEAVAGDTIFSFGLDNQPTGYHIDKLYIDDAMLPENSNNLENCQKVIDNVALMFSILEPNCPVWAAGTIYTHLHNLYAKWLKDERWKKSTRKAINNGVYTFPEKINKEFLDNVRIEQGEYIYNCQYMLDPIDTEKAEFLIDWIKCFKTLPENRTYSRLLLVDPANSKKKRSDFTVILVVFFDEANNAFVVDGTRDKLNASERVDAVFKFVKKYSIPTVYYESIGYQESDDHWINQRRREQRKGDDCNFTTFPYYVPTNMCKEDRIRRTIPAYKDLMVFWKYEIPFLSIFDKKFKNLTELFREEYCHFPFAPHDDIMDCFSMSHKRLPSSVKSTIKEEVMTQDEWFLPRNIIDRKIKKMMDKSGFQDDDISVSLDEVYAH